MEWGWLSPREPQKLTQALGSPEQPSNFGLRHEVHREPVKDLNVLSTIRDGASEGPERGQGSALLPRPHQHRYPAIMPFAEWRQISSSLPPIDPATCPTRS